MLFYGVFVFYILYRLFEMKVAKHNERELQFPVEVGKGQRYFMICLHALWFLSMLMEYQSQSLEQLNYPFVIGPVLFFCVWVRYQSMSSLGVYWNTKIFKLNDQPVIRSGIYRYFRHPNYLVVVIELLFIPLLFSLYKTALVFSLVNLYFIIIRTQLEQKVLYESH